MCLCIRLRALDAQHDPREGVHSLVRRSGDTPLPCPVPLHRREAQQGLLHGHQRTKESLQGNETRTDIIASFNEIVLKYMKQKFLTNKYTNCMRKNAEIYYSVNDHVTHTHMIFESI